MTSVEFRGRPSRLNAAVCAVLGLAGMIAPSCASFAQGQRVNCDNVGVAIRCIQAPCCPGSSCCWQLGVYNKSNVSPYAVGLSVLAPASIIYAVPASGWSQTLASVPPST